jgi:hypothetical protein
VGRARLAVEPGPLRLTTAPLVDSGQLRSLGRRVVYRHPRASSIRNPTAAISARSGTVKKKRPVLSFPASTPKHFRTPPESIHRNANRNGFLNFLYMNIGQNMHKHWREALRQCVSSASLLHFNDLS